MAAPLRVKALGQFDVRDADGGPLRETHLRRTAPLLKELISRVPHAWDRVGLAATLWPGSAPRTAAANLRVMLHALRAALREANAAEALSADGDRVSLNSELWQIDADDFERSTISALREGSADEQFAAVLRYAGAFLPDDFAESSALRRTALESLYRSALLRCAATISDGALERRLWTQFEADREDCEIARALSRHCAAHGNHLEAARVFTFHQEAAALAQCICAVDETPAENDTPSFAFSVPALWERTHLPPFIGRDTEVAQLGDMLDDAIAGRRRTLVLVGAPGIGKTRLAGEIMAEAQDRGACVFVVTCGAARQTPLRPFIRTLETVLDAIPDAAAAIALDSFGAVLARLSQGIRRRIDFPEKRSGIDVGRAVFAVARTIENLCTMWPVVLLVEDLHLADAASLAAFSALAASPLERRLLLVGTAREDDLRTSVAGEVLETARGETSLLRLGPLSHDESLVLARRLWDSGARPEIVARRAGGNPLGILEYCKGGHRMRKLESVIAQRIQRQPAELRTVLEVLALAEPVPLSEVSLRRMLQRRSISQTLERALTSRLLQRQPLGYCVAHGIFTDVIENQITAARAETIHARLALLPEFQDHPDALAFHYLCAGPVYRSDAITATLCALDEAMAVRNPAAILDILRRARAIIAPDDARLFPLAYGLGIAETFGGDAALAHRALREALAGARDDGQRIDAYVALIGLAETSMRVDEGLQLCDEAESILSGASDPRALPIVQRRAFLLLLGGRYDEATVVARLLLRSPLADEIVHVRAQLAIAIALAYRGRRPDAIEWFQRARRAADRLGEAQESALVVVNLASAHFHAGALGAARDLYVRAAEFSLSRGRLATSSISIRNAGECEYYIGNHEASASYVAVAERRAARTGRPMLVAEAQMLRGAIAGLRESPEAFRQFEAAAQAFVSHKDAKLHSDVAGHALVACRYARRREQVELWEQRGLATIDRCADVDTRCFFNAARAAARAMCGDAHIARVALDLALADLGAVGAATRRMENAALCCEAAIELRAAHHGRAALASVKTAREESDAQRLQDWLSALEGSLSGLTQ